MRRVAAMRRDSKVWQGRVSGCPTGGRSARFDVATSENLRVDVEIRIIALIVLLKSAQWSVEFGKAFGLEEGIERDVAMIRSELIQKIADENPHLYQRDVERIVNTIFEEIIEAMARGDRVELRGFGAFSVKKRDARLGRNPRTGDSVDVEEKHVPFFKTGKLLRDRLNGK